MVPYLHNNLPREVSRHPLFACAQSGIITAEHPVVTGEMAGNDVLVKELTARGLKATPVASKMDAPHAAYVVENVSPEDLFLLGKKFGQRSVIHLRHGIPRLIYTADIPGFAPKIGKVSPGSGNVWFSTHQPEHAWTHLPGIGYVRFEFNHNMLVDGGFEQKLVHKNNDNLRIEAEMQEEQYTLPEVVAALRDHVRKSLDRYAPQIEALRQKELTSKENLCAFCGNADVPGECKCLSAEDYSAIYKASDEVFDKLIKVTPPGISEKLIHDLKDQYGHDKAGKAKAYATAWKIAQRKAKKGEMGESGDVGTGKGTSVEPGPGTLMVSEKTVAKGLVGSGVGGPVAKPALVREEKSASESSASESSASKGCPHCKAMAKAEYIGKLGKNTHYICKGCKKGWSEKSEVYTSKVHPNEPGKRDVEIGGAGFTPDDRKIAEVPAAGSGGKMSKAGLSWANVFRTGMKQKAVAENGRPTTSVAQANREIGGFQSIASNPMAVGPKPTMGKFPTGTSVAQANREIGGFQSIARNPMAVGPKPTLHAGGGEANQEIKNFKLLGGGAAPVSPSPNVLGAKKSGTMADVKAPQK